MALENAPALQDVSEQIMAAADCLAKARIGNFTSGVFPQIDEEGVTVEEARALEQALLATYQAHSESPGVGSVLYALSKARNLAFRPLFLRHTARAMRKLQAACWEMSQAVCGLDDLVFCEADPSGYPVILALRASSMLESTIDQADTYSKRENIIIPHGG